MTKVTDLFPRLRRPLRVRAHTITESGCETRDYSACAISDAVSVVELIRGLNLVGLTISNDPTLGCLVIHPVPAADYFALPALSISRLKELRRSPLHYRYLAEHPKESAAMTLGTAAHCATLEPERFCRDYVAWCKRTESGRMAIVHCRIVCPSAEEYAAQPIAFGS